MPPSPQANKNQTAALSRLFSSAVVQELVKKGSSAGLARLARLSGLPHSNAESVGHYLDRAYSTLSATQARDEYVYKSTIIKKVLLGRHSLRTATFLSEFRVGTNKADLAILNGTSTVYEIKSDRDNLDRLAGQLAAYRKVFARIFVVAAEQHIAKLERSLPDGVGILLLNKNLSLSELRQPNDNIPNIDPRVLCSALRRTEAEDVLKAHGRTVPEVPNTQIASVLRDMFADLTPHEAHQGMVKVLKRTRTCRHLSDAVESLPASLIAAALTMNLGRQQVCRLSDSASTPMATALTWG